MTVGSSRFLRLAAVALVLAGSSIVATAAAANASSGCGEYSFGFEGTRLLNDGISDSAGPFSISMPAGTYDITLHSFDDHADHPGQVEQTQEQWYFTLDNGYRSPVSSDIPDDGNTSTDTFRGVALDAATAITVQHLREGGINSVSPMCVGFTTVEPVEPVEEVVPEAPVDEPEPEVEIASPPPAKVARDVPVMPDVPVEVEPAVEVNPDAVVATPAVAPQLAITGPSHTLVMLLAGAALVGFGIVLVVEERRRSIMR